MNSDVTKEDSSLPCCLESCESQQRARWPGLLRVPQEIHLNIYEQLRQITENEHFYGPRNSGFRDALCSLRQSHSELNNAYRRLHLRKVGIYGVPAILLKRLDRFIEATTVHWHIQFLSIRIMTHEWEEKADEREYEYLWRYCFEEFATKLVRTLQVVDTARAGKPLALHIDLRYLPDECLTQIRKKLDGLALAFTEVSLCWLQDQDLPKQLLAAFRQDHLRDFSLFTSDDETDQTPGPHWKSEPLNFDIETIGELQPLITRFSHRFEPGDWRTMPYLTLGLIKRIAAAFPRLRHLSLFGLTGANDDPATWIRAYLPNVRYLTVGHYNHRPYCIADLYDVQAVETGASVADEEQHVISGRGCFRTRNSQLLARYYLQRNSKLLEVRILEEEADFECSWIGTRTADGQCRVEHVCDGVERYCRCKHHPPRLDHKRLCV